MPPINKDEDNHLLDHPHVFLDEIMRQAEDSEIIKLTMNIRAGKPLERFIGKEVQVLNKSELTTGMLLWADQILCATNSTRVMLNNKIRELLGKSGDPQEGEKIICLKNNWNIESHTGNPLVNGTVCYLKNPTKKWLHLPPNVTSDRTFKNIELVSGNFISDTDENYGALTMDKQFFINGESGIDWKTLYKMHQNQFFKFQVPDQFTYGYAITTHKSQGSEWDKVLVIEEGFPFDKEEHKQWLYTAATRSCSRLVIIKKD